MHFGGRRVERRSSAVILVCGSTWLIEWRPSGEPWIISAEASWLGLAGALMMWYRSEPGPSVGALVCVAVFLWVCACTHLSVWVCVCLYMCLHSDLCTCVHMRTCVCVCAFEEVYVHSSACVCVCVFAPFCSLQPVDLSHFARAGGTGGCQAAPGAWVQFG